MTPLEQFAQDRNETLYEFFLAAYVWKHRGNPHDARVVQDRQSYRKTGKIPYYVTDFINHLRKRPPLPKGAMP